MIDLKGNPFYLKDKDIVWVEETLASLTVEEKVGQLFCLIHRNEEDWKDEADFVIDFQPGGTGYRPMKAENCWTISNYYQGKSKVPMLISGNLERGGSGVIVGGTTIGCNMQIAATNDVEMARKQGLVCAREAKAVGANWGFSPCIDIDYNFRNPITNTRTYGSNPELVAAMGKAYVDAMQSEGVMTSIKHFPGDGMDERDQHVVATYNSMSCEDWDKTYGQVYKACIDAGALSVMPGHIMHPAYSKKLRPGIKDDQIMPATMSEELLQDLLRNQLGFNGMIVSDATTMVGMMTKLPRAEAVPKIISAGCDMFLYSRNLEEDYQLMMDGVDDGRITPERLDEAVTRILATKAAIGLHEQKESGKLMPESREMDIIGCQEHKAWTVDCADRSVTLVKSDGTLPLGPGQGKKILLYKIGDVAGPHSLTGNNFEYFKGKLESEGFEVEIFEPSMALEMRVRKYQEVVDTYDFIIYFCALMTKSNQSTVRIEWLEPIGANAPAYVAGVPTIFVSFENPYHLLDVPMVKTYINAYSNTPETIDAVVEKLMGRSPFKGLSPVDPFCDRWDTRL